MKCRECGANIKSGEKICSKCGASVPKPKTKSRSMNMINVKGLLQNKNALTVALILLLIIAIISFAKYRSYKGLYETVSADFEKVSAENQKNKTEIDSLKKENEAFKAEIESDDEETTEETTDEDMTESSDSDNNEDTDKTKSSDKNKDENKEDTDSEDGNDSYVVQPGDSAISITKGVFGEYTPELWEKLKEANGKGDTDWVAGETVVKP